MSSREGLLDTLRYCQQTAPTSSFALDPSIGLIALHGVLVRSKSAIFTVFSYRDVIFLTLCR